MNAKETKIQQFLEGTKQFVVPLFQRPYSWERGQWETLWDDLIELYGDDEPRAHFLGSVVTMPATSVPEGVGKFVLIDGQQRTTTILILLAVIRDAARRSEGKLAEKIENLLLLNPYHEGTDRYKLLPTQVDRAEFLGLVAGQPITIEGQVAKAYQYFAARVRNIDSLDLEKLQGIIVRHLSLVSIVLDSDDIPHLIFESLNAKGRALSQSDLIRNYFFMRIHPDEQGEIYEEHWAPLQGRLGQSLTECIRHFLMIDGSVVRQGDVFLTLKARADCKASDDLVAYLRELARFAGYYDRLLHPDREPSPKIRRAVEELNRIEVTTAYPFLLKLHDDHANGLIAESQVVTVLEIIQNFLIRRFVAGIPTNTLNKIFPTLYSQAREQTDFIDGVRLALAVKNYPSDTEFRAKFRAARLYGGDRVGKGRLILDRLEESYGHRESARPEMLSIEHIMPQTLTDWWREHLGVGWRETHSTWLNTVGNLTLTGYNPALSNSDFPAKRAILEASHVELNREISVEDRWDRDAIERRADALADRAIAVWPDLMPGRRDETRDREHDADKSPGRLDLASVLERLGGVEETLKSDRLTLYRLNNGKVIATRSSKVHRSGNFYWYGLRPESFKAMRTAGLTHLAFIMGHRGVATIPVETVAEYCGRASTAVRDDGQIRHYHINLIDDSIPRMYLSADPDRYPLADCFLAFD